MIGLTSLLTKKPAFTFSFVRLLSIAAILIVQAKFVAIVHFHRAATLFQSSGLGHSTKPEASSSIPD
jgi:hypothetical protein